FFFAEIQNGFEKKSCGGLAVGSGDAGDLQLFRWMAVEISAQLRQRTTSVRNYRPGNWLARLFFSRVGNNCDCAVFQGCINVAIAVRGFAVHGYEQPSRFYPAGIIVQPRDLWIAAAVRDSQPVQQL